ncbi:MAG: hypothetical protein EG826_09325 [Deltaproteobacteria bacterium]|nr:hypothetical protein [Deltaproteobacteria bacterium]
MKKYPSAAKYVEVVLFVLLAVACGAQLSQATSPKSVVLAYDAGTQTLSVTIDHSTLTRGVHHIKYVEIKKNGVSSGKNEYSSQPTDELFTYTYKIPAVKGDSFEITAICNMWGRKTSTFTVP